MGQGEVGGVPRLKDLASHRMANTMHLTEQVSRSQITYHRGCQELEMCIVLGVT